MASTLAYAVILGITCSLIAVSSAATLDIEVSAFSESGTTAFTVGGTSTFSFSVSLFNPVGNANSVSPVTGGNFNYDFLIIVSNVDLTGGGSSTLALSFTPTITPNTDRQLGIASTSTRTFTGSASVSGITAAKCPNVKFICVQMSPNTGASFTDPTTTNNVKCLSLAGRITCSADPSVFTFSETSNHVFSETATNPVTISFQLKNLEPSGSNADITAASGSNMNFAFSLYYSTNNAPTSTALAASVTPFVSNAILQAGLPGQGTLSGKGSANMPLTSSCSTADYLCLSVSLGSGAAYTDKDNSQASNTKCIDITSRRSCKPDPEVLSFSETGSSSFKMGTTVTANFNFVIKNAAATTADTIPPVPVGSANFAFEIKLTDVDLEAGGSNTVSGSAVTATVSLNTRLGLVAGAQTATETGSASLTMPSDSANCNKVTFICLELKTGSGAGYTDVDPAASSNIKCHNIAARVLCSPDPSVKTFAVTAPSPALFTQGVATSVTMTFTIENKATGQADDILAVTAPAYNYAFTAQFSDVDMASASDTIGITPTSVTLTTAADAIKALASGANFASGGTVSLTLSAGNCIKAKFLCLHLTPGSGYTDADTAPSSNTECASITTKCSPNPTVTTFTETTGNSFKQNVATSVTFEVKITNLATAGGGNNIASVNNPKRNYALAVQFSNADMSAGSDTLSIPTITPPFTAADLQQGLTAASFFVTKASTSMTLAAANCNAVRYVCVTLSVGTGASYTDADPTKSSNIKCIDITQKKSCTPNPVVDAFLESSGKTFIVDDGVSLSYSITLKNSATAGATLGNDIVAATGTNKNYELKLQFSNVDMGSVTTDTLGFTPVSITMSPAANSQRALAAGSSFTTTGTHSLTLATAHCPNAKYLCTELEIPATATYADFDPLHTSNIKCIAIDNRKSCFPDPAVSAFAESTGASFKPGSSVTVALTFTIENAATAATGNGNGIQLATGSNYNYEFELALSDKDMRAAADSLNIPRITVTTAANRQQALAAGADFSSTGSAVVTIPSAQCSSVKYLCFILKIPTTAQYKDATATLLNSNAWCVDISARISCAPDPEMFEFLDTSTGLIYKRGVNTGLSFSAKIKNAATGAGNDIAAVTGSNANYRLVFQFSDKDIEATADTLGLPTQAATTTADLKQGLTAGSQFSLIGTGSVSLPGSQCAAIKYLCLKLEVPVTASYTDADVNDSSNVKCVSLTGKKSCFPDPKVTAFQETSLLIYKAGVNTATTFSFTTKNNAGSASGNDVIATSSPKKNFKYELKWSDNVNLASNSLTLSATVTTVATNHLTRGLSAGQPYTATGSATTTIPAVKCPDIKYLCIVLSADATANYEDADASEASNSKCDDISQRIVCAPDPAVQTLTGPDTFTYTEDIATSVTVTAGVKNIAGTGNNIVEVTGSNANFKFESILTDVDLSTGASDTLTITPVVVTVLPGTMTQSRLDSSSVLTFTGTASVTIAAAKCPQVVYMCLRMSEGTGASYTDLLASNNIKCVNIDTVKICAADIEVTVISESANAVIYQTTATTLSFSTTIKNKGLDSIDATTGSNYNFDVKMQLSDKDIRTTADTLGLGEIGTTITGSTQRQAALANGGTHAMSGTVSVTIASTKCNAIRYLCVHVTKGNNAKYIDKVQANNWQCKDVDNQKRCSTDPSVKTFADTTSPAPIFFYGTAITLDVSIGLKNAAPAASGNNILAVTGSDRNFNFKVWFSNVDMGTGASNTLGVSAFAPALPTANLQQALTASAAATTITGTVLVNLPQGNCGDARYLCAEVQKGAGAQYVDSNAINNAKCIDISTRKSCRPDPSVRDFREPGNQALVKGTATTINIQIDLENVGTPGSGNDIVAVTGGNVNYKFELFLSDVNMQFATDNLNLAAITPTITSDVKQALQVGSANMKSFAGSASVTIPAVYCNQVKYLCVKLSEGSGASYRDASNANNIKCKDISAQKGCNADPSAKAFDTIPSSVTFKRAQVQTVNFNVQIENVAIGASSNLAAVTGGNNNFEIVLKLTDADIGAGGIDTLQLADIATTIPTAADLQQKLDVGSANAITITGSASVEVFSSICNKASYLCVHVKQGTGASYTDSNPNNNFKCKSLNNLLTCSPDLEIKTLSETTSPAAVFAEGSAATYKFKMEIINTASNVANNKILAVASPKKNYKVTLKMTNGDLGTAVGADTLNLAALTINIPDPNEFLPELAVGPFNEINGDSSVTLSQNDCPNVNYLCFNVEEDTTNQASFVDINKNYKNWKCQNIKSQKRCKPVFTTLPATVSVSEDQVAKKLIHTTAVTDGNGDALTYKITSNIAGAPFSIEADGKIYVNANPNLDYESGTKQYQLTVEVKDGYFTETALLTVNIVEEPEPPFFTNLPATLTLAETATGTVFTAVAQDQDAGDVVTVTATTSPASSPFTFTAATGVISLPASPALDYETTSFYIITLEATDKTSRKAVSQLNITITDVPEPPILNNLPATVTVTENELIGRLLFTITATDPEGQSVTFGMVPTPNEGNFFLSPPGGGNVMFKSNPNFDKEKTGTYTLTITGTDGVLVSAPKILTVTVQNVNEKPILTNLPAITAVAENAAANTVIFDTGASDPEGNPMTYKIFVSPTSGTNAFQITTQGKVQVTQSPKLDYETVSVYNLSIEACDAGLCSTPNFLRVDITDANEAPVFNPTSGSTNLDETTPLGTVLNVTLSYVDPDKFDTPTFSLIPSTYSSYFSINSATGAISLAKAVDYETLPAAINFDILLQDTAANQAIYGLTVNIININDNPPVFTQSMYNAGTMDENKPGGTAVVTVSASDADKGTFGDITYSITDAPASTHFLVTKQADKSGLISIKSPVDRETYPSMTFNVYATDGGGRQTSASVQVTFADVNDNRPIFDYPFYDLEIRSDAASGTSVGTVHATDKDVTGNTVTYEIASGQGKDDFTMGLTTGQLDTKNALVAGKLYTINAIASDSGNPVDKSVPAVMRVDAYDPALYLLNWEVAGTPAAFTDAKKQKFIDAIAPLCTPCIPHIAEVTAANNSVSRSILRVYFLHDNSTGSGDTTVTKRFIPNTEILAKMTKDSAGTPSDVVNLATFNDFPVYNIGPSVETTTTTATNWWLDTPEGIVTIVALSLLGVGLIAGGIALLAKYGGGLFTRTTTLPKTTNVPKNNVQLKDVKNNNWDARYNKSQSAKSSNNTRVTELKEQSWRNNHRPPSNPSNKPNNNKSPPSPVERNASRLSQISSRQIDLNVDDGRWSPNKLNRPSPLTSDQRYW